MTVTPVQIVPAIPTFSPGEQPPGATLIVYNATGQPVPQDYTATFTVSEQPAAVVLTAGELKTYTYNSGTGELVLTFTHVGYVPNSEIIGPSDAFALAFVAAVPLGQAGPPEQMRGSWMSTNISPLGWTLIPPTPQSPGFGYELKGPDGERGFFKMFIPQTLIDAMSQLYGRTLTADDLALFNGNSQASVAVTQVEGGAMVDINVTFQSYVNEVDDEEATMLPYRSGLRLRAGSFPTVTKRLTVQARKALSLTASPSQGPKGTNIKLFGWAKNFVPGDKVKLTSQVPGSSVFRTWKRLTLDDKGYFSTTFSLKRNMTVQALYKKSGAKAVKSPKVKIKKTRR